MVRWVLIIILTLCWQTKAEEFSPPVNTGLSVNTGGGLTFDNYLSSVTPTPGLLRADQRQVVRESDRLRAYYSQVTKELGLRTKLECI